MYRKALLLLVAGTLHARTKEQKLVDRFVAAQRKVESAQQDAIKKLADLRAYCATHDQVEGVRKNGLFGCTAPPPAAPRPTLPEKKTEEAKEEK